MDTSMEEGSRQGITTVEELKAFLQQYKEIVSVYQDLVLSEPDHPQRSYFSQQIYQMERVKARIAIGKCGQCGLDGFHYGNYLSWCMDHVPKGFELKWCGYHWSWIESGKCSACGEPMERETCDTGFALQHGPWSCRCGYSEEEEIEKNLGILQVPDKATPRVS